MNQVVLAGKVIKKTVSKSGIALEMEVGFGDWAQTLPVFFPKGKSGSSEEKKFNALEQYLEEEGEISVSGRLQAGKAGPYVAASNFFVGRFKPWKEEGGGQTSGKPSAGGPDDSDDLPF